MIIQPLTLTWNPLPIEPLYATVGARLVRVLVSDVLLVEMMTDGWSTDPGVVIRCIKGLPPGARFVGVSHGDDLKTAAFLFEHESFAEVRSGQPPILSVEFSREAVTP